MEKNQSASAMAKLRWANTTPEQRLAHSTKMLKALKKARKLKKAE